MWRVFLPMEFRWALFLTIYHFPGCVATSFAFSFYYTGGVLFGCIGGHSPSVRLALTLLNVECMPIISRIVLCCTLGG